MRFLVIDAGKREQLNGFVASSPRTHFKQLYEWGEVLQYEGTRSIRAGVEQDGALRATLAVCIRRLPGSPLTFMSGSRGPILDFNDRPALAVLLEGLRDIAREHRAVFLRVDPDCIDEEQDARQAMLDAGFKHLGRKNWSNLNDPRVVMTLDLSAPESELLGRMRASHRQNIRKVEKKGVVIRDAVDEADVRRFYRLWAEVGERRGFPVRNPDYYRRLWSHFVQRGQGRLLVADRNSDTVAALLMILVGHKAWVLHSASTSSARKLKPNEAMWWEAMRWAKQRGATVCDFGGTGTDWPPREDSPGYSLYQYKRGFRAEAAYLTGYYDVVFKPRLYKLFRLAEERLLPRAVSAVNFLEKLRKPSSWAS